MIHPTIRTLSRLIEGDLGEARRFRVERHVAGCAKCRARLELMEREVAMALRREETSAAGAALRDGLMAKLPAQPAWAREGKPCGEVEAVQGVAIVFRNGDVEGVEAFPGMALLRGDSLRVIGKSLAMVRLADGSSLYLNRGSEATFFKGRHELELAEGELFAMMNRQPRPFRLWTPAATLEVLGTDFDAKVSEDKSKTELSVLKGRVAFENKAGRAVVEKRRQVKAASHSQPAPARLADYSSIGGWAAPLRSQGSEEHRGMALGRWLAVVAIVVIALAVGLVFQNSAKDASSRINPPSKADVDHALQSLLDSSPNINLDAKQMAQLRDFFERYILSPRQIDRHVFEPYPEGRALYYPLAKGMTNLQVEQPSLMILKWTDDRRLILHADFRQAADVPVNLSNFLFSALSIEPQRVKVMPDVPAPPLGDYVVRSSAPPDTIIQHLIEKTEIVSGVPLAWEWRTEPQRVLVVSGELHLNVDPLANAVMLYSSNEPSGRVRQEEIAANPGHYEENSLEFFLGSRLSPLADSIVVNEVRPPWDQKFRWHYDIPPDFGESPEDRDRLFENIAKQTGLTFTWADRPVQVLHVWRGDNDREHADVILSKLAPSLTDIKRQPTPEELEQLREFVSLYALASGENAKFIPPPGHIGRLIRFQLVVPHVLESSPYNPNENIYYFWDNEALTGSARFNRPIMLDDILPAYSRESADSYERVIPPDAQTIPAGDVVTRRSAPREELVRDLFEAIRGKAHYPFRPEWRSENREGRVIKVLYMLPDEASPRVASPEMIQSATEPRAAINDATLDGFITRMKEQGSAGEREAMRAFLSQYGLAEGQVVKYVPQPGTSGRVEFVRLAVKDPSHPPRSTDPANVSIIFAWVEGASLNYMNRTSIRHMPGGFSIRELARNMWRLDPMLVEGPPEALSARFPGDFIYRPSTNPGDQERLVDATMQLLRDKAGYRWRATWINTPREIIIATGVWRPNPESKTGSSHSMFLLYSDTFTDGGLGGGADIVSFMQTVGELTGHPVITKTTGEVPDYPGISFHVTSAPMNLSGDRAELRRFLDRLERQTGLTFSIETRPIRRIVLEKIAP